MKSLYKPTDKLCPEYTPPETFPYGEYVKVAEFPATAEGGRPCTLCETRTPARFYKLAVYPSPDSIGELQHGVTIFTGSGQEKLIVSIARGVADGMLVIS